MTTKHNDHHPDYLKWHCPVPPALSTTPCKLPTPTAIIKPPNATTTITPEQFRRAAERAAQTWNSTGYVRLTISEHATNPEIIQTYAPIDREGAILALSSLPCYGLPVRQKYDSRDHWDLDEDKSTQHPSLWLVIAHELGHAIGLDHLPPGNIMAPYYHQMATNPGKEDLQELKKRYDRKEEKKMPTNIIRLALCIATGLPAIIECIAKAEALAHESGEASPLLQAAEELRALRAELRAQIYGPKADPTQTDPDAPNSPVT